MLVSYYEEIHDVIQKRLDECSDIIEEFYMVKINEYKESILMNSDEGKQTDITQITQEHSDKLKLLRLLYDNFLKNAETEFFDVLKHIRCSEGGVEDPVEIVLPDGLVQQPQIEPPAGYGADNEHSLRSSGINIDTSRAEFPSEAEGLNKDSHEIRLLSSESDSVQGEVTREQALDIDPFNSQASLKRKDINAPVLLNAQTPKFTHNRIESKENYHEVPHPGAPGSKAPLVCSTYVWGSGKDGRCGNGKQASEIKPYNLNGLMLKEIQSGYHHTAGITKDGFVVTWGRGVFGQLGHGNNENYAIPTPVEVLLQIPVHQITCGWQHTMALSYDRRVFSWGYGEDGQLGHGNT